MKKLINDVESVLVESLQGFATAHADQNLVLHDQRRHGDRIAALQFGHHGVP